MTPYMAKPARAGALRHVDSRRTKERQAHQAVLETRRERERDAVHVLRIGLLHDLSRDLHLDMRDVADLVRAAELRLAGSAPTFMRCDLKGESWLKVMVKGREHRDQLGPIRKHPAVLSAEWVS